MIQHTEEEEEKQPLIDRIQDKRQWCSLFRVFGAVLTMIVLALLVYAAIIYAQARKLYSATFDMTELRVLNNHSLCTNPIPMQISGIVNK
jgi:hypothetical protein